MLLCIIVMLAQYRCSVVLVSWLCRCSIIVISYRSNVLILKLYMLSYYRDTDRGHVGIISEFNHSQHIT